MHYYINQSKIIALTSAQTALMMKVLRTQLYRLRRCLLHQNIFSLSISAIMWKHIVPKVVMIVIVHVLPILFESSATKASATEASRMFNVGTYDKV